jgi:hypothetical protein
MVTTYWKIGLMIINTLPAWGAYNDYLNAYVRVDTAKTWDNAQTHCQGMSVGLELAQITNDAERIKIEA